MSREKGPHEKMAEKVFGMDKPDGSDQTVGDEGAILGYLACIAQHGDPGMDMCHWSDFVNRVRRLAAQVPSLLAENARLRQALRFIAESGDKMIDPGPWFANQARAALSAPDQPKEGK